MCHAAGLQTGGEGISHEGAGERARLRRARLDAGSLSPHSELATTKKQRTCHAAGGSKGRRAHSALPNRRGDSGVPERSCHRPKARDHARWAARGAQGAPRARARAHKDAHSHFAATMKRESLSDWGTVA